MSGALSIAGEVSGAAAALAGLILVFFGAALSNFENYDETQKHAVRARYRWRAWPAFVAFILALGSCGLALYAKATMSLCSITFAIGLLAIVGIGILISALMSVLEIG